MTYDYVKISPPDDVNNEWKAASELDYLKQLSLTATNTSDDCVRLLTSKPRSYCMVALFTTVLLCFVVMISWKKKVDDPTHDVDPSKIIITVTPLISNKDNPVPTVQSPGNMSAVPSVTPETKLPPLLPPSSSSSSSSSSSPPPLSSYSSASSSSSPPNTTEAQATGSTITVNTQKRQRDAEEDDDENASKRLRNEDGDDHDSNMNIDDNNNGNSNGYNDDYGNGNYNDYDDNYGNDNDNDVNYGNDNDNDNDNQQNGVNDDENDAQGSHTFCLPPSNTTLAKLFKNVSFYGYDLFESQLVKTEFKAVYKRIGESQGSSLYERIKYSDALLNAEFMTLLKFYFCSESQRGFKYSSETDANFVFLLREGKLPALIFFRENFITSDVIVTLKDMVHDDSYEKKSASGDSHKGRSSSSSSSSSSNSSSSSGKAAIGNIERQQIVYVNGDVYEGEVEKNKPHGQGTLTFKTDDGDGDVYTGSFKNGKFDGDGKYIWGASGDVYIGKWSNDVRCGIGKLKNSSGTYDGEWNNDKQQGQGELKCPGGKVYSGKWDEGSIPKGRLYNRHDSDQFYDGEFNSKGQKDGQGRITFGDGTSFEGTFHQNFRHGPGVLTHSNGITEECVYHRGTRSDKSNSSTK